MRIVSTETCKRADARKRSRDMNRGPVFAEGIACEGLRNGACGITSENTAPSVGQGVKSLQFFPSGSIAEENLRKGIARNQRFAQSHALPIWHVHVDSKLLVRWRLNDDLILVFRATFGIGAQLN